MAYRIIVSPRAQEEIENAIDFYSLHSKKAPLDFITSLKDCYNTLKINPFYQVQYKSIRSLKLNKFPYSLYFTLNEESKTIKILACFQNQQNPRRRPC